MLVEHELRRIEDLHREPASDLHLGLVERRIHPGTSHRRTPAHRVGAELVEDLRRDDDIALRLAHLLAIRVDDEARDSGPAPRQLVLFQMAAHHPAEQPGADDVVGLWGQVHREGQLPQIGVTLPTTDDLRGQRAGCPGVHDIGVGDEAARPAPLRFVVARRR
ncbi:hypothetical protein SDC9_167367 [bioreactor metagenome]|uniref:Uncharacterized protein n=1 Tax=bioreactor metagenome TaxID=1076179 RepID=A0A645FZL1_9ZZZZ